MGAKAVIGRRVDLFEGRVGPWLDQADNCEASCGDGFGHGRERPTPEADRTALPTPLFAAPLLGHFDDGEIVIGGVKTGVGGGVVGRQQEATGCSKDSAHSETAAFQSPR